MEQVTTALKQTITGGLNLQKPLFIIDTPEIIGEQAAQFQNQANQWHENFVVHQVVVNPATYVGINRRVWKRSCIPLEETVKDIAS